VLRTGVVIGNRHSNGRTGPRTTHCIYNPIRQERYLGTHPPSHDLPTLLAKAESILFRGVFELLSNHCSQNKIYKVWQSDVTYVCSSTWTLAYVGTRLYTLEFTSSYKVSFQHNPSQFDDAKPPASASFSEQQLTNFFSTDTDPRATDSADATRPLNPRLCS
jgi:hypothetical protein